LIYRKESAALRAHAARMVTHLNEAARLRYASANLPRYTSYPTAPHFSAMEEAQWRSWLGALPNEERVSLYVHVPFCQALCWYCGCHTSVTRSTERLARYAAALSREAALLDDALAARGGLVALHFGGGTPSAIGGVALAGLVAELLRRFQPQPSAEIAVEFDPRNLDAELAARCAEAGVNRASLGVQSLDEEVQRRIGRVQPARVVEEGVAHLRGAGVEAINFDLMYGLPGQDVAQIVEAARFTAALGIPRVAVFGYAHVPWMKANQRAITEADLPDAAERLAQADAAEAALVDAGYVPIGLDHFALPEDAMTRAMRIGTLRRNFQGYTTDAAEVLLPLGASSIGRVPEGFAQNLADERGWLEAVESGRLPVARGFAVSDDDTRRAAAIERLMSDMSLDLARLAPDLRAEVEPRLAPLLADGLVAMAGDTLVVPDASRRFLRHVAACFDAYLGKGAARHSRAA
jgi:oxygen-independent coproporphyrinogen III oxidase